MRTVFFGSSHFSCHVLDGLLAAGQEVALVVTQPDQPAGRKMQLRPTPVCELAEERGLAVLKPRRLRGPSPLLDQLKSVAPEALAVASYGRIIPPELLELTAWPLNVHPSALPLYRGPSPLRTALLEGLTETEVCIMRMTERIDDGPVLRRAGLRIGSDWNYSALELAAGELGGRLLAEALQIVKGGRAELSDQNHELASYTRVHHRADTWIDWTRSSRELHSFVRAWDPDAGACTSFHSGTAPKRLKVWRAETTAQPEGLAPVPAGTVLRATAHELLVQCGDGCLSLLELQPESRQRMTVASFQAGSRLSAGSVLGAAQLV